jgi:hypothetical protein
MKKNITKLIIASIIGFSSVFFLSGYEVYSPEIPQFIGSVSQPFKEKGVHITAKAYDGVESKEYLKKNLLQLGYRPVQVTIQNNTETPYLLSQEGMEISSAKGSEIAGAITRCSIPRSIAFKVGGFFFWPLMIPATLDGVYTFKNHVSMKRDFHAKSIKEEGELIPPYSTVNRIVFLPWDQVPEEFTLYLENYQTKKMSPFVVKIA